MIAKCRKSGIWGYRSSLTPEPVELKKCMSDYVALTTLVTLPCDRVIPEPIMYHTTNTMIVQFMQQNIMVYSIKGLL